MKSKYALDFGSADSLTNEQFRDLILTHFDRQIEPELGPIPDYVLSAAENKPPE